MSKAAFSVYVFGIYLAALGLILVIVPNLLLRTFGIPETNEVWIRVVGMLVLILAVFDTQMARKEVKEFFWIGVYARCFVIFFFIGFVLSGYAPAVLILFGAVDLVGALWTWWALRSE